MKFTALAVVILALGIILGLALRGAVFEAEAAKPPPEGRLIELGPLPVAGSSTALFPLVDTRDCSEISAAIKEPAQSGFNAPFVSMDGSAIFRAFFVTHSGGVGSPALLGAWPFVQLEVSNSEAVPVDITAWIWCAP